MAGCRLILAILTVGLVVTISPSSQAVPRALRPIEPLVDAQGNIVCTTFAISATGRWLTALHCRDLNPAHASLTIAGMKAETVRTFPDEDLLALSTPLGPPALRLASTPPTMGAFVQSFGYPFRTDEGAFVQGVVAQPTLPTLSGLLPYPSLLVAMPVCRGMSGSPVMNTQGEVWSVFQALHTAPCASFGVGLTYARLVAVTSTLWDATPIPPPPFSPISPSDPTSAPSADSRPR